MKYLIAADLLLALILAGRSDEVVAWLGPRALPLLTAIGVSPLFFWVAVCVMSI